MKQFTLKLSPCLRNLIYGVLFVTCVGMFAPGSSTADRPTLVIDSGGSTRFVKNVIFTKDGKQVVSVGDDKVIRVWDVSSGATVRTIRTQASACTDCITSTIALSPDNNYLAVGGSFPSSDVQTRFAIYVIRFDTGEVLQTLKGHRARVICLAFSQDGNRLASGSAYFGEKGVDDQDSIRTWILDKQLWVNERRLAGHEDAVSSLSFSPDGNWLASGSHDNNIQLWNLTGTSVAADRIERRHNQEVYGVSFSPDGAYLASGGLDGKINLWDRQGKFLREISQEMVGIHSLAFSPDKNKLRLAAGLGNGTCKIFSIPDGAPITSFKRFDDNVWAIGFSPDGAAVASSGGFNGEISLWQTETGNAFASATLAGNGQTVWSVGFARDGHSIAFGTKTSSVRPNNYGPLEQVVRFRETIYPEKSSSQAPYRISLGGYIKDPALYRTAITQVKDLELKTRVGQMEPRRFGSQTVQVPTVIDRELKIVKAGKQIGNIKRTSVEGRTHRCYTFTNDGRYIISGGERGYLALYETEVASGEMDRKPVHRFLGHTNEVWSVAVSPDDQFLVSGSSDQTVRLWDIKSGINILTIFVGKDQEWVAWTTAGYYTSSGRGDKYFGWQVNRDTSSACIDCPKPAESVEFFSGAQFAKEYYRPDVIAEYFRSPDIQLAVAVADSKNPRGSTGDQATTVSVESILPPSILILSPGPKESVVTQRMLRIKLQAVSSTKPITVVKVALNGVPKGTFRGDPKTPEESKKIDVEMVVALQEGENSLYVVAANAGATSKPEVRKIFYKAAGEPEENTRKVLPPQQRKTAYPLDLAARYQRTAFLAPNLAVNPWDEMFPCGPTPTPTPTPTPIATPASTPNEDDPVILRIRAPRDPEITVRDEDLTIDATATSRIRKHIELKAFLNDEPLPVAAVDKDAHDGVIEDVQVTLKPGANVLRFTASDGQTSIAPQIRRIIYNPRNSEKPNLIFLGIGISKYQVFRPPLQFADKDARDMATFFCSQGGPDRMYASVKAHLIADEDASRPAILRGLRWLNDEAKFDNDVRVVLIAGHGGIIEDTYYFYSHFRNPDGEPEEDSIRWSIFWEKLKRANSNAFLFVDTCRSGKAAKGFFGDPDSTGVLFYSASKPEQSSLEDPGFKHGIFTQALLEALSGAADKKGNNDGHTDSTELERFLEDRVVELNRNQRPVVLKPTSLLKPIRIAKNPINNPPGDQQR